MAFQGMLRNFQLCQNIFRGRGVDPPPKLCPLKSHIFFIFFYFLRLKEHLKNVNCGTTPIKILKGENGCMGVEPLRPVDVFTIIEKVLKIMRGDNDCMGPLRPVYVHPSVLSGKCAYIKHLSGPSILA